MEIAASRNQEERLSGRAGNISLATEAPNTPMNVARKKHSRDWGASKIKGSPSGENKTTEIFAVMKILRALNKAPNMGTERDEPLGRRR